MFGFGFFTVFSHFPEHLSLALQLTFVVVDDGLDFFLDFGGKLLTDGIREVVFFRLAGFMVEKLAKSNVVGVDRREVLLEDD